MSGPQSGADAVLRSLKANGIDYLLVNAGSDFAPIIESYARNDDADAFPKPIVVTHETVAVGMAHGYYLATGKPQAVMVHVNVGLANAVMGLINAHSDNAPIIMLSGRTPLTEHDRLGARQSAVQFGQEMFDQTALVREVTKFNYELRYAEQAANLVTRAYAIAMHEPRGPVYLSLPREPLAELLPKAPPAARPVQQPVTTSHPDQAAIQRAAALIANAKAPLMIVQRGDTAGRVGAAAARMAAHHAIKLVEVQAIQNVIATNHPMLMLENINAHLPGADLVLVVDAPVPWIPNKVQPDPEATIIHVGPDPLFQNLPIRSFRCDLAITGATAVTMETLAQALDDIEPETGDRYDRLEALHQATYQKQRADARSGNKMNPTPAWVAQCVSDILDEEMVVVCERGPRAIHMELQGPNQLFSHAFSGGLGWGLPAAIGVALANPDRLTIAIIGDGSHIFANPVACHQVMEAYDLPVLTIVMNNKRWNAVHVTAAAVYPDGAAAQQKLVEMADLSTSPDFVKIAAANRAYAERVEHGADLPAALQRALQAIKVEKRQALIEVWTDATMA